MTEFDEFRVELTFTPAPPAPLPPGPGAPPMAS
jgi:hypothetical protein